jgi:hypothetical protein
MTDENGDLMYNKIAKILCKYIAKDSEGLPINAININEIAEILCEMKTENGEDFTKIAKILCNMYELVWTREGAYTFKGQFDPNSNIQLPVEGAEITEEQLNKLQGIQTYENLLLNRYAKLAINYKKIAKILCVMNHKKIAKILCGMKGCVWLRDGVTAFSNAHNWNNSNRPVIGSEVTKEQLYILIGNQDINLKDYKRRLKSINYIGEEVLYDKIAKILCNMVIETVSGAKDIDYKKIVLILSEMKIKNEIDLDLINTCIYNSDSTTSYKYIYNNGKLMIEHYSGTYCDGPAAFVQPVENDFMDYKKIANILRSMKNDKGEQDRKKIGTILQFLGEYTWNVNTINSQNPPNHVTTTTVLTLDNVIEKYNQS